MDPKIPVLIVTGPVGVGKSSVAGAIVGGVAPPALPAMVGVDKRFGMA